MFKKLKKLFVEKKIYTNNLINETSPYLLQHAHNPVDWFPWSEEAFEKAKKENKPIFLSVGYSACHWCHVMEHESFEDEETAELMNKLFINIKVDREERPDVDTIYMNVVQMLTGQGGWPMSVFMTPDMKPYYGGTYFPKTRRYNMPSFKEVLVSVEKYYRTNKETLDKNTASLINGLNNLNQYHKSDEIFDRSIIEKTIKNFENYFDYENGGFGTKPKFPNTFNIELLMREYLHTKDQEYLEMVKLTLKKMCDGGIYDHLGGGFFRYSVDEQWLIPHFEKMLYDNALLIKQLIEVYQLTKDDFYKNKALESLDYIIREMYQEKGGFYSTQDADSEGEEGKFYTWARSEVLKILGKTEGTIFCDFFDISNEGNFEHGKNNLQCLYTIEEFCEKYKLDLNDTEKILTKSKKTLFETRNKRIFPAKDTKIITAWNGLILSTFAKAYDVFDDEKYLEKANETIDFIFSKLYKDGFLLRTFKDEQSKYNAYLEDYAFMIDALIDLYQATLNTEFLEKAKKLNETLLEYFWDENNYGFFFTAKNHENLIVRTKEITDHSIPSGNSIALKNLLRLARITDDKTLMTKGEQLLSIFTETVKKYPLGVSSLLCTLDFYFIAPIDIVVVGNDLAKKLEYLRSISLDLTPNKIIYSISDTDKTKLTEHTNKNMLNGKTTIYFCKNLACERPFNI